jgi:hypothetical protein
MEWTTNRWVGQGQLSGVEQRMRQREAANYHRSAITLVTEKRATERCQVQPNLVGASGTRDGPHQRGIGVLLTHRQISMRQLDPLSIREWLPDSCLIV